MKSIIKLGISLFSIVVVAIGFSSCTTRLAISTEPSDKIVYQEVEGESAEVILAEEIR